MIFLIDGPSIDPEIRATFSQAWRTIIGQTGALQIPRAVYFISSVGQVQELVPLTSDLEALRDAADAVGALPTYGTTVEQRLREVMDSMEDPRAPGTAGWSLKLRSFESEERSRSIDTLDLLTRFCDSLSARPGRTALVWVSTGIKLTEGGPSAAVDAAQEAVDPLRPLSPRDTNWAYFTADAELLQKQDHLQEVANSANVSIYAVDPTPLAGLRGAGFDVTVGGNAAGGGGRGRDAAANSIPRSDVLSSSIVQDSLDGLRDSLRSAAEGTGGLAMINYTDLGAALGEIREHASRFYLLTYAPRLESEDDEFHEVRVEVRRAGLTVRERGGYVAMPREEKDARAVAAALALPGTARALRIEAEAYRRWSNAGQLQVQIGVNVSASDSESIPELDLYFAVLDGEGRLVRQVERGIRAPTTSPVPGSTIAIIPFGQFDEEWWDLKPGIYEVRVAARDTRDDRLGAARLDLEVPDTSGTWYPADVRLGVATGGASTTPLVGSRATAGQQVVAFIELTGGVEPEISGQILTAADAATQGKDRAAREAKVGEKLPRADRAFPWGAEAAPSAPEEDVAPDQPVAELPRYFMRQVAESGHAGALPLPTDLAPGRYIIRIQIEDPAAGREHTFRIPLEISTPAPGRAR
jgi:VWFA-related protein